MEMDMEAHRYEQAARRGGWRRLAAAALVVLTFGLAPAAAAGQGGKLDKHLARRSAARRRDTVPRHRDDAAGQEETVC